MMRRESLGATARITLDVVTAGAGVIGQSPTFAIQRLADGKWFQASDGTWQPTIVENAGTQTDSTNLPGRYHFDFDQSLDDLAESSSYVVKKQNASGTLVLEYEDLAFGPVPGVTSPELCSVTGRIFNSMGEASPNELVRATLEPVYKDAQSRGITADRPVITYTNELGDFDLGLVRGATFRLEITSIGYNRRVTIPDQATALFTDL